MPVSVARKVYEVMIEAGVRFEECIVSCLDVFLSFFVCLVLEGFERADGVHLIV